jgi:hypothetical protein
LTGKSGSVDLKFLFTGKNVLVDRKKCASIPGKKILLYLSSGKYQCLAEVLGSISNRSGGKNHKQYLAVLVFVTVAVGNTSAWQ